VDDLLEEAATNYLSRITGDSGNPQPHTHDPTDNRATPARLPPAVSDRLADTHVDQAYLLALIVQNTSDLIGLHKPDGTILFMNPSTRAITGYEPEEMVGTNPYDRFHPEDLSRIQESHNDSLEGNIVRSLVYRTQRKDGSYLWLETMTTPVINTQGEVEYLVTVSRDISARVQMEQELRQERDVLSQIMATSPSGITVVDRDGQIIYANRRAEEIHGAPQQDITSLTYDSPTWQHTDYDGNPWPDEKQPFVQVMTTRQPVWDVRHAIRWSDGRVVYLAINGAPILDEHGEISKVVFTVEDYTQRKLQEDQLITALEREKVLNEMKSTFISMVSHEFRTPMSIIMTSTSLLRMKKALLTEEEYLSRLARIEAQIKHLNALIADVTAINKEDSVGHRLFPSLIQLSAFFEQVAEEVHSSFPNHNPIQIINDGGGDTVLLDLFRLQQIFVNLFSNAMKYSEDHTETRCRYLCDKDVLKVTLYDQGIGIPHEDQAHLFEAFFRASNVSNISGTGLGMAIVKRALDALGGTMQVESEVGVGTTFTLRIPLPPPASPPENA